MKTWQFLNSEEPEIAGKWIAVTEDCETHIGPLFDTEAECQQFINKLAEDLAKNLLYNIRWLANASKPYRPHPEDL